VLICGFSPLAPPRRINFGLKIMDAYYQVLTRLYEVTDGKDTKAVDFKELVKSLGFFGNYHDIFERLNGAGWIAEDKKADFVRITHWGVSEIKKSPAAANQTNPNLKSETNKALAEARELNLLLEIFSKDASKDNLSVVERKIVALIDVISRIKSNLD
jgi:phage anti-repressor protein